MSWQDVKDYYIAEEVLLELIEEYQAYLDRKASGLEAVWVVPEAESEEE